MTTYGTFDIDSVPCPHDCEFEPTKPKRRKQKMTTATITYNYRGHKVVLTLEEVDTAKLVEYMIPGTIACIEHSGGKVITHDIKGIETPNNSQDMIVCADCFWSGTEAELDVLKYEKFCPNCHGLFRPA